MVTKTKMSTKPNTLIIDALTGEQTVREMTDVEFEQHQIDLANAQSKQEQAEAKATAKAEAQAKLAALGLTVEDLRALGL